MIIREVAWPCDAAAVARSLARSSAWFWLDGAAPSQRASNSYLGEARTVHSAVVGNERAFLQQLRDLNDADLVPVFSYEYGVALLDETSAGDSVAPAFAIEPEVTLVLDHDAERAWLRAATEHACDEWLERHGEALSAADAGADRPASSGSAPDDAWRTSGAEYLQQIADCQQAIADGDAYVLCLTDTAEVPISAPQPLETYLRLRGSAPELRGAVIVTAGRALMSGSPEQFLSLRGRQLFSHPMKGTRPRDPDPTRDAALAQELATSAKERAENLMIVDLVRNDLSRVCEPGSVRIEGFLRVEPHQRVHQLVSTVTGTLCDGLDFYDALGSCFPGGSMTGAPKLRAVQLLAELEQRPRGLYSGCFGWVEAGAQHAELAMTIRSIELRPHPSKPSQATAFIGAGGGITADSEPEAELAEKMLKAHAALTVLGLAPPK